MAIVAQVLNKRIRVDGPSNRGLGTTQKKRSKDFYEGDGGLADKVSTHGEKPPPESEPIPRLLCRLVPG